MARFSKADVLALSLADDLKKLDLADDRAVLAWVTAHCTPRADPRLGALRAGSIPMPIQPNRRPGKAKTAPRKRGRRTGGR